MRKLHFGKTFWLASILGAILPVVFFFLSSLSATPTPEAVTPSLYDLLEAIGFCGFILSLPGIVVFVGLNTIATGIHEHGYVIPLFDLLPVMAQSALMLTIGLVCNVASWLIPVTIFRRLNAQENDKGE